MPFLFENPSGKVVVAKVRLFVIKEDIFSHYDKGFEDLKHEVFCDELETAYPENRLSNKECIEEEISNIGWDEVQTDMDDILKNYQIDDVIEIVADYNVEYNLSHGYDGDEWDSRSWLENKKHNKLTDEQIKRYIGDFERNAQGLIEFKNSNYFNHIKEE